MRDTGEVVLIGLDTGVECSVLESDFSSPYSINMLTFMGPYLHSCVGDYEQLARIDLAEGAVETTLQYCDGVMAWDGALLAYISPNISREMDAYMYACPTFRDAQCDRFGRLDFSVYDMTYALHLQDQRLLPLLLWASHGQTSGDLVRTGDSCRARAAMGVDRSLGTSLSARVVSRPRPGRDAGGAPSHLRRCAAVHGYNLHADIRISAQDRTGLERLSRYLLRPPLSKARIEEREKDDIVVGLKRPWSDGTTEIHLSRLEFPERLCALIPPPRANTVLYHGVLAGHAALRSEVVPKP